MKRSKRGKRNFRPRKKPHRPPQRRKSWNPRSEEIFCEMVSQEEIE
jgi:hypothetical protein